MTMDRTEFEALRDLPRKVIKDSVRLVLAPRTIPLCTADDVRIENSAGVDLTLNTNYTPATGRFVVNVHVRGVGPICRLCVNGAFHAGAGRTHKHAVTTARCAGRNLPNAVARPDIQGQTMAAVWQAFCASAAIDHHGALLCDGADPTQVTL